MRLSPPLHLCVGVGVSGSEMPHALLQTAVIRQYAHTATSYVSTHNIDPPISVCRILALELTLSSPKLPAVKR